MFWPLRGLALRRQFGDFVGGDGKLAIVVLFDRGNAHGPVHQAERRVGQQHDIHRLQQRVAPAELEFVAVADIGAALQQQLRRDRGAGCAVRPIEVNRFPFRRHPSVTVEFMNRGTLLRFDRRFRSAV